MTTTSTAQLTDHIDLTKLPVTEKSKLCAILDQNDTWAELGHRMMFTTFEIAEMQTEADRKRKSPSEVLIGKWSRHGHIVTELFKLLSLMQHYQAMEAIKHSVPTAYHVWIKPVQPHISRLMKNQSAKLHNAEQQSQIFRAPNERPTVMTKADVKESLRDLLNIPEIPIDELAFATDNWSEANVLGKGGFGTVYRGEWLSTKVAVKKLEYRESRSGTSRDYLLQSLNELRHLNHCRHDNILPIYGYSLKDETCLVVYQLMPGGSLEERLSRKNGWEALTWPQRWTIVKCAAR
jgi:interleukin-1 receptor-associated kinase 1